MERGISKNSNTDVLSAPGKKTGEDKQLQVNTDEGADISRVQPRNLKGRPSTALASDAAAGLGFDSKIHKAFFYNNDMSRPKIFLNLIESKIDLKQVKKR